jgi:hypothetical protein
VSQILCEQHFQPQWRRLQKEIMTRSSNPEAQRAIDLLQERRTALISAAVTS